MLDVHREFRYIVLNFLLQIQFKYNVDIVLVFLCIWIPFSLEYTDCSIQNYFQFKFLVELRFLTPLIIKDFMNTMSHN